MTQESINQPIQRVFISFLTCKGNQYVNNIFFIGLWIKNFYERRMKKRQYEFLQKLKRIKDMKKFGREAVKDLVARLEIFTLSRIIKGFKSIKEYPKTLRTERLIAGLDIYAYLISVNVIRPVFSNWCYWIRSRGKKAVAARLLFTFMNQKIATYSKTSLKYIKDYAETKPKVNEKDKKLKQLTEVPRRVSPEPISKDIEERSISTLRPVNKGSQERPVEPRQNKSHIQKPRQDRVVKNNDKPLKEIGSWDNSIKVQPKPTQPKRIEVPKSNQLKDTPKQVKEIVETPKESKDRKKKEPDSTHMQQVPLKHPPKRESLKPKEQPKKAEAISAPNSEKDKKQERFSVELHPEDSKSDNANMKVEIKGVDRAKKSPGISDASDLFDKESEFPSHFNQKVIQEKISERMDDEESSKETKQKVVKLRLTPELVEEINKRYAKMNTQSGNEIEIIAEVDFETAKPNEIATEEIKIENIYVEPQSNSKIREEDKLELVPVPELNAPRNTSVSKPENPPQEDEESDSKRKQREKIRKILEEKISTRSPATKEEPKQQVPSLNIPPVQQTHHPSTSGPKVSLFTVVDTEIEEEIVSSERRVKIRKEEDDSEIFVEFVPKKSKDTPHKNQFNSNEKSSGLNDSQKIKSNQKQIKPQAIFGYCRKSYVISHLNESISSKNKNKKAQAANGVISSKTESRISVAEKFLPSKTQQISKERSKSQLRTNKDHA